MKDPTRPNHMVKQKGSLFGKALQILDGHLPAPITELAQYVSLSSLFFTTTTTTNST